MPFQKQVQKTLAVGVEGDFASNHMHIFAIAGECQLFARDKKVKVGNFAWLQGGAVTGAKPATGFAQAVFVHRQNNAVLLYGEEGTLMIPENHPVSSHIAGEFWGRFDALAEVGQKVFASNTDGSLKAGTKGATIAGYTETNFIVRTEAKAGELAKISSWGV